MRLDRITNAVFHVDVPEADLRILCACPENAVKFLARGGLIHPMERDGAKFESGPNAILLSELPVQNGRFSNLAEFPVLQMLYRQGMLIPGHPNNTGRRPMIIGLRDQVQAQADYIYCGNYGITDPAELSPEDPELGDRILRVKHWFAFGEFRPTDGLLDLRTIDSPIIELRDGVFLRRLGVNRYEFIFQGKSLEVDLNLRGDQSYGCPYELPSVPARREGFSIVHLGEGDGWDPENPCMSSLVMHEGDAYLIDAGPNIEESLEAIGLGVNCLRGIFHTHVHDDHFVGLTALIRSEQRLGYWAAPVVRRSAQKKMEALSGVDKREFNLLFDTHDLKVDEWNDVNGMEVMPIFSPHPIETTILRFRARGPDGTYRTYAHYADLSSFKVINSMTGDSHGAKALSAAEVAETRVAYLEPADVKKVDVGGGMIHGEARDFEHDTSAELLLSHGVSKIPSGMPGGTRIPAFGETKVFLPLAGKWQEQAGRKALSQYFPTVPQSDIDGLVSRPVSKLAAGSVLCRRGDIVESVFLTLGGRLERFDDHGKRLLSLRSGALVNAIEQVRGQNASLSFKAAVDTTYLAIPVAEFNRFVTRNELAPEFERIDESFSALSACPIFAELESLPGLIQIATAAARFSAKAGEQLDFSDRFLVLVDGRAAVFGGADVVEFAGPGDVCGEHSAFGVSNDQFRARAFDDLTAYAVPIRVVVDKPLILWKLRERYEQRLAVVKTGFSFRWRPEYAIGLPRIDESHEALFTATDDLMRRKTNPKDRTEALLKAFGDHFSEEEQLMAEKRYPDLPAHHQEHQRLLDVIAAIEGRLNAGEQEEILSDAMKDCLIYHTLVMDRSYLPWLAPDPA